MFRDNGLGFPLFAIAPARSKEVLAYILYLIPADRAAGQGLARCWSRPVQERSLTQANTAHQHCEISHYTPIAHGRTSLSGCREATLVTSGVIPVPVGPDPEQPWPQVGFISR